ncbi:MAG TPA: NlpC/P60 family protein [Thermohalobaculum sp.]|nr:NlpC/P60 family protein [Thermohalobaculum sp.]
MTADPRLTPVRPDLAARRLLGEVGAERFADPTPMVVTTPLAPLSLVPDPDAALDTELIHGERFDVYETADGLAWGQSALDGYVGYVPADCLGEPGPEPTHRVTALVAQTYPVPDMKSRPLGRLTLGARVAVEDEGERFVRIAGGGHLARQHVAPIDEVAPDWVAVAERFLGTPYLWGGRSPLGCDCSALVQLPRQMAGLGAPRDSDMQEAGMGETIGGNVALRRGDLVFWKRHVGIMLDVERLLHANAHHMATTIEPLEAAIARIEASGGGPATRRARLDSGGCHA